MRIESFHLAENDWVPNNPRLPVAFYRKALSGAGATLAEAFERLFAGHGWAPDWRDGIYGYHHYHSTAHEALGVFFGTATLELGGIGGRMIDVSSGDAIVLPVGTGHRCLMASEDFQVVGAYAAGEPWDICREAPDPAARARMLALPDPEKDPVTGAVGLEHGS